MPGKRRDMDLATILIIPISRLLLGFSSLKFISHNNFNYLFIVQASRFDFIHYLERQ